MLKKILGVLSPVQISLFTLFRGRMVGRDQFGNKYYHGKPREGTARPRRWVMYKGRPEASKIPPEWHGWLHYQTDVVPQEGLSPLRKPWQKPYTPNATGTDHKYVPPGHTMRGSKRDKATGDYEAWSPK